jgi:hypothetical protein
MAGIHFDLRFPKDQYAWASYYPHGDADRRVAGIGTESRRAGFYAREDAFEVSVWRRRAWRVQSRRQGCRNAQFALLC